MRNTRLHRSSHKKAAYLTLARLIGQLRQLHAILTAPQNNTALQRHCHLGVVFLRLKLDNYVYQFQ